MPGRIQAPTHKPLCRVDGPSLPTGCHFEFRAPPADWIIEHPTLKTLPPSTPSKSENSILGGENRTASCAYFLSVSHTQPLFGFHGGLLSHGQCSHFFLPFLISPS